MSAGKTLFTFIAGVASGLALVYYADPKGSEQNIQKLDKELKKNRKLFDEKMVEYKKEYNTLVEKYMKNTKDMIDNLKSSAKVETTNGNPISENSKKPMKID